MDNSIYLIILLLGVATYGSAVWQMLKGQYSPSFFSRGVWFLLGINSFAGVLLGDGSTPSVVLASTLFIGNAIVFGVSYKKGSRDFHSVEKFSLLLLIISVFVWAVFNQPFVGLVMSLVAHFIGGVPTIWRVAKNPKSEQAYHWYFFFVACIITILASNDKSITAILFPMYFALFDGLIIALANRERFTKLFNSILPTDNS